MGGKDQRETNSSRDYSNVQFVQIRPDKSNSIPIWAVVLIIVISFAFISIITDSSPSESADDSTSVATQEEQQDEVSEANYIAVETPPSETQGDITYTGKTVEEIVTDIKNNSSDAKQNYSNNYFVIRGTVGSVDDDSITVYGETPLHFVICYYTNDEQRERAKGFSEGDVITVKGKITEVYTPINSCNMDIDGIE